MNLSQAIPLITRAMSRMDELCEQQVFDEWSIVEVLGEETRLRWYKGDRRQQYIRDFRKDTALLRRESLSRFTNQYDVGGYEFAGDGIGTQAESFVVIGEHLYLILTNTTHGMAEIAANPLWLRAQAAFAELAERFQSDPLSIVSDDLLDEILLK